MRGRLAGAHWPMTPSEAVQFVIDEVPVDDETRDALRGAAAVLGLLEARVAMLEHGGADITTAYVAPLARELVELKRAREALADVGPEADPYSEYYKPRAERGPTPDAAIRAAVQVATKDQSSNSKREP